MWVCQARSYLFLPELKSLCYQPLPNLTILPPLITRSGQLSIMGKEQLCNSSSVCVRCVGIVFFLSKQMKSVIIMQGASC